MKKNLFFAFIACLLVGCGSSSNQKSTQVLRVCFPTDPYTLDPRKGGDPTSSTAQFMLFEGLTRLSEKSSSEPAIAETIAISEDGITYTFYLREAYWTNGDPVTAMDFESAWKDMMDPSFPCPNANLVYPIKNAKAAKEGLVSLAEMGVQALDERTLQVTLEGPTPYFLELISFCVFSPVPHKVVEKHPNWADKPGPLLVTNGPFVLKKWKISNQMIFEKNPTYWEADQVALDEINIAIVDHEMTALHLFETGKIDFLGSPFSSVPVDSVPDLQKKGLIQSKPLGATTFCSFNLNRPPFNNPNIRKAFAYSINRSAIVNHLTQSDETVATGPIPPLMKFQVDRQFFPDGNRAEARKHLTLGLEEQSMELEEINDLTFIYPAGGIHKKIAETLQQEWYQTLGIKVSIECIDLKIYFDKLSQRDYDFAYAMWVIQYNDVMNIFDRFKFKDNPKNYPGWENPEYISILNESMTISDQNQRIRLLEQAEEIMTDEMPLSPIYHWNQIFLQKPHLKGVYISPIGSIHLGKARIES